ncbi:MAG: helix-turn-helix domain-containing protein [Spirochaetaceae bacterium]|jgi:transcriptional regulator with XRE-family HTH domain|nr:helix-turn-helix domain-containing protein [Spirochaetaceae bacterium]
MSSFSDRLRSEIEYACLNHKEFAAKAGIKKRALDGYLGVQQSMPPADTAVKMARVLGISVEYLVTGKEFQNSMDISKYIQFHDVLDDLLVLPLDIFIPVKAMIKTAADQERKKNKAVGPVPKPG